MSDFDGTPEQAIAAALRGVECEAIHDESYYKGIHGYCEGLKCSNCGEPLFSEFGFCPWCGVRIRKLEPHSNQLEPSRWFDLFGTPTRAARTLSKTFSQCDKHGWHCNSCDFYLAPACPNVVGSPVDYDALLEWLEGAER